MTVPPTSSPSRFAKTRGRFFTLIACVLGTLSLLTAALWVRSYFCFDSVVRNDDEIRKTDNMLTRAQIAVYPVDARGLFNNPANSAVNGPLSASPTRGGGGVQAADIAQAFRCKIIKRFWD